MAFASCHGAMLTAAMKDLLQSWDHTETAWRDKAREKFDKDYVEELVHAVRAASNAIQQGEAFLNQIRRDCR